MASHFFIDVAMRATTAINKKYGNECWMYYFSQK